MAKKPVLLGVALASLALVAVGEIVLQAHQTTSTASTQDWRSLAKHVRTQWQPGDVVWTQDAWAEPLVRMHLGDLITLTAAGRSGLQGYSRVWSIAVGDTARAPSTSATTPNKPEQFGPLSVGRWTLPELHRFDFAERLATSIIEVTPKHARCARREASPAGGGLGRGPIKPAEHWQCPGERGWIGVTTIEDLAYRPRRCVWHPARLSQPIRITFPKVPRSDTLVLHGGHYLRDERKKEGPPVRLNVYVDGKLEGQMTHQDGDGWKRFEVALPKTKRASVAIEAIAEKQNQNFCWSAVALAAAPSQ